MWIYRLDLFRRHIAAAETTDLCHLTSMEPQELYQITYAEQDSPYQSGAVIFDQLSRGMRSIGRHCLFTAYSNGSGDISTLTYALLPRGTYTELPNLLGNVEMADAELPPRPDSTRKSRVSGRRFVYNLPEESVTSEGCSGSYLYDLGIEGKNAVWVEEHEGEDGNPEYKCRLATFIVDGDSDDALVSCMLSTVVWEPEGFSWSKVKEVGLDDSTGVLTILTEDEYWILYLD